MTFFSRKDYGRLYLLRITLPEGFVVHKVGMTHSDRSVDRMMEIVRSWFMQYRFVPHVELRLDRVAEDPLKLEQLAHKVLKDYQWIPDLKVDGGTEMFTGLDEIKLLHFLRHLEANQESDNVEVLGKLLSCQ